MTCKGKVRGGLIPLESGSILAKIVNSLNVVSMAISRVGLWSLKHWKLLEDGPWSLKPLETAGALLHAIYLSCHIIKLKL